MNPTEEQLKARQAATTQDTFNRANDVLDTVGRQFGQAPIAQTTPTISLDTLQNPQTPIPTPKIESSAPPVADITSYIDRYKNFYQAQPQETQLADVYNTLFSEQSKGGRQAATTQAQEQYGYNARQSEADAAIQRVAELNDQITQARNLSREQYSGTDALQGFVDARTESVVRKIAAERDRQQAVAELAQGRADRALQLSQQAVDNEFTDRTDRMNALVNYGQYLSQQIERGELRADKTMQRAIEAQTRDYERQQRELEAEKQTRKDIAQIMLTARQYGADDVTVKRIQSAGTFEDAIALAGSSIKDPKLELQLAQMRLDMANTRDQIRSRQLADQLSQATGTELPPDAFLGMSDDALKSNVVENVSKLKLTEAQGKAVTFAMRMISANKKINALVGEGKQTKGDYDPTTLLAVGGRLVGSTGANTLDTNLRDFIGAALRFESGAAIPESEFESGNRIYSPAKLTITDKEISQYTNRRADAINAMISATGPAGKYIKQYYDETGNGLRTSSAEKDEINALFQQDDFNPNDY